MTLEKATVVILALCVVYLIGCDTQFSEQKSMMSENIAYLMPYIYILWICFFKCVNNTAAYEFLAVKRNGLRELLFM